MTLYYTGIGSRETPKDIMEQMRTWAKQLSEAGYTLRSGGADGADTAFEVGCREASGNMEIFLPWKKFNKNPSPHYEIPKSAYTLAQKFHPAWFALSPAAHKLMARNIQQVCGKNLDSPSQFVICYTSDGCESHSTRTQKTGGTGQAISVASELMIPVFNLKRKDASDNLTKFLEEHTNE